MIQADSTQIRRTIDKVRLRLIHRPHRKLNIINDINYLWTQMKIRPKTNIIKCLTLIIHAEN